MESPKMQDIIVDGVKVGEGRVVDLPSGDVPQFDWRSIPPRDRYRSTIVPDRLSVEPSSEWHCPIFMRRICVRMGNRIMPNVIEYSVSEGWIRQHKIPSGKVRVSKNGSVLAFKRFGKVQVDLVGPLVGKVVTSGKKDWIEVQLIRADGQIFPVGRVDPSELIYNEQPVTTAEALPEVAPEA